MRELVEEEGKVVQKAGGGGEGGGRGEDLPEYFEGDIGGYQKPI